MASEELPSTYKRLMLVEPGGESVEDARIEVMDAVMPGELKMDEVLIKVAAAPINPSDYGAWLGPKKAEWQPRPVGNEGSGVVVKVGSKVAASLAGVSVGCKVGFTGLKRGQGSYSEYVVGSLAMTFVMDDAVPVEDAASFFVNPYTAVGILDTALSRHRARAFVHTAAASQVGQMLVKLAARENVQLINVVRSEKQAKTLADLGASTVVVVQDPETDEHGKDKLREVVAAAGATVAFDAVAGAMTGFLVSILPVRSTVYVYGRLDGDVRGVPPIDLIYRRKQLKGWYLKTYLLDEGPLASARRLYNASARVRAGLADDGWCKTSFVDCDTSDFWAKFIDMKNSSGFTDKKLRIRFDRPIAS
mmetsp:Transcript_15958/g.50007  ORF Transcript_15958/g.50007 Transcript_15958/m.50007 type:complete len:362 (-) Transcript_15958:65-1150(-)